MQASQNFLMAKKEMSTLLKGHQTMKLKADKFELEVKNKDADLKKNQAEMVKMEGTLKKNGEELEEIRKKATDLEKAPRLEFEAHNARVDAQKNELDLLESEVTTRVKAKLMYQFMMNKTASWTPKKYTDLFFECLGELEI